MVGRLTDDELAQIRERAEKAAKGPWKYSERHGYLSPITPQTHVANICNEITRDDDVDFIAHAREDIPKLLAEIERFEEEVMSLETMLIMAHGCMSDVDYESEHEEISDYLYGGDDE